MKLIETHGETMQIRIGEVEKMNGDIVAGIILTIDNPAYADLSMEIAPKDDVSLDDVLNNFSQCQADYFFETYFAPMSSSMELLRNS